MGCFAIHIRSLAVAVALLFGMALDASSLAVGQPVPAFELEAVSMRGDAPGTSRVDLYTKIPYSRLQFISQSSGFIARYEVMAEVYEVDARGNTQGVVLSRIWDRNVPPVRSYAQTQADSLFDMTTYSETDLPPGRYMLEVQIEDKVASTTFIQKMALEVRDLEKPVSISDLLIADTYDAQRRNMLPNVANTVGHNQQYFTLFYQLYAQQPIKVNVGYTIYQLQGRSKPSVKSLFGWGKKPTTEATDVAFETSDLLQIRAGANSATLRIPVANFEVGDYIIRAEARDGAGTVLDEVEKPLTIRWMGLARQISNLKEAVAQLRYVAKDKELDTIRKAETEQEMLRKFLAFWDKRDPTPGTPRNERMEEYYYRISYANEKYSRFNRGWLTDRGEVFVIFGEPDYVDRHPFGFGSSRPYEIWRYERIGRRFIFVDQTGVGDYELLVPIWDERTRIR